MLPPDALPAAAVPAVALVAARLSRASGGVREAVAGLAHALGRGGACRPTVIGLADPADPEDWRAWGPDVRAVRGSGPASLAWGKGLGPALAASAPDIVDIHGLWLAPSLVAGRHARARARPWLVTPHGMLDPWALRRSAWKKRLAEALFEGANLRGAACLRALAPSEAAALRAHGLRNPIAIVPNGVLLPDLAPGAPGGEARAAEAAEGIRTLLFLGRIDPKKGVEALLAAWAGLVADGLSAGWRLRIAGWGEARHVARARAAASALGLGARDLDFAGPVFGAEKDAAFRGASAFVLPSLSEGLPMAVLEAWSYGLPVLMSEACNLPEGFAAGAALPVGTDPAGLAAGLADFLAAGAAERAAMGRAGRTLAERRFGWESVAARLAAVYAWTLGGGAPPAGVEIDR